MLDHLRPVTSIRANDSKATAATGAMIKGVRNREALTADSTRPVDRLAMKMNSHQFNTEIFPIIIHSPRFRKFDE